MRSMNCLCRNLSNSSAIKVGPLSVYRALEGLYWAVILLSFWPRDWADFDYMWKMKGTC